MSKTSYTIRISSSDDRYGKLSMEKVFTISINDLLKTTLWPNSSIYGIIRSTFRPQPCTRMMVGKISFLNIHQPYKIPAILTLNLNVLKSINLYYREFSDFRIIIGWSTRSIMYNDINWIWHKFIINCYYVLDDIV